MTVKEYVDHRKQFPITRKIMLAGAIMANAASAAYPQAQEPEPEVVVDDDLPIGQYL